MSIPIRKPKGEVKDNPHFRRTGYAAVSVDPDAWKLVMDSQEVVLAHLEANKESMHEQFDLLANHKDADLLVLSNLIFLGAAKEALRTIYGGEELETANAQYFIGHNTVCAAYVGALGEYTSAENEPELMDLINTSYERMAFNRTADMFLSKTGQKREIEGENREELMMCAGIGVAKFMYNNGLDWIVEYHESIMPSDQSAVSRGFRSAVHENIGKHTILDEDVLRMGQMFLSEAGALIIPVFDNLKDYEKLGFELGLATKKYVLDFKISPTVAQNPDLIL